MPASTATEYLTVSKVGELPGKRGQNSVFCTWFDSDRKVQEQVFEPYQLKAVEGSTESEKFSAG